MKKKIANFNAPHIRREASYDARARRLPAFTLPEILVAVSLFALVATIAGGFYVQAFNETRRSNVHNQLYEDARFIMSRLAQEIQDGMIDYDEYYNQNVVLAGGADLDKLGQNYGRYYSAFFHPGNDEKLGFDCNDGERNKRDCTPLRKTLDRHTGANPFVGKYSLSAGSDTEEDAFCGTVTYVTGAGSVTGRKGLCAASRLERLRRSELYLISADSSRKTVFARERVGGTDSAPMYALSLLRLTGKDTNGDGIIDRFVCAPEFQCRGSVDVPGVASPTTQDCGGGSDLPAELPRSRAIELEALELTCDTAENGFSKDFVPVSPLRTDITALTFYITPEENPAYAFAETDLIMQPRVTVVLTVSPNIEALGSREPLPPLTLVETISSRVSAPIPAPLLVE